MQQHFCRLGSFAPAAGVVPALLVTRVCALGLCTILLVYSKRWFGQAFTLCLCVTRMIHDVLHGMYIQIYMCNGHVFAMAMYGTMSRQWLFCAAPPTAAIHPQLLSTKEQASNCVCWFAAHQSAADGLRLCSSGCPARRNCSLTFGLLCNK